VNYSGLWGSHICKANDVDDGAPGVGGRRSFDPFVWSHVGMNVSVMLMLVLIMASVGLEEG
jgi:hypothetical protein